MDATEQTTRSLCTSSKPGTAPLSDWSARYGAKFRWRRLTEFPAGIRPPQRVRVYHRADHYILSWWDTGARRNLAERVDEDLLAVLVRARQIDERLAHHGSAGTGRRRLAHEELVECYLTDLERRTAGGELCPSSVRRYRVALCHYLNFVHEPTVTKCYPHATCVNRAFRLAFDAYLVGLRVHPKGHSQAPGRPMRGQAFITDAVRTLLEWAADPDRGNLLPETFRNPFRRPKGPREVFKGDPLAAPDITLAMALDFMRTCDLYQLRLFVPMLLFGLRRQNPCFLFREYIEAGWLRVPNNPDLAYQTKGRRDKRFPLIDSLGPFWERLCTGLDQGLLYVRRRVLEGKEAASLRGTNLAGLTAEFQRRWAATKPANASTRLRLRDGVLREAGGLSYDHVQGEFEGVARKLRWPATATLKDFRHLFCTTMGNTAVPEAYRRYLMGHAPGKAAVMAYTHLNEVNRHYSEAVRSEWQPLVDTILSRLTEAADTLPVDNG